MAYRGDAPGRAGAVRRSPLVAAARCCAARRRLRHGAGARTTRSSTCAPAAAPAGNTFEALWAAYRRATGRATRSGAARRCAEIRRLRIERNIREPGADRRWRWWRRASTALAQGERDARRGGLPRAPSRSTRTCRTPTSGSRCADVEEGPARHLARRATSTLRRRSRPAAAPRVAGHYLLALLLPVAAAGAAGDRRAVVALALLLRHGALLLHDLEEALGPARSAPSRVGVFVVLLLLPLVLVPGLRLAAALVAGRCCSSTWAASRRRWSALAAAGGARRRPGGRRARGRGARAQQNPLFRAAVQAVEGGPDARASARAASARSTRSRTTATSSTCSARQYRRRGATTTRPRSTASSCATTPNDRIALNNLANLEFARGEFPAAIARYKQGIELGADARVQAATFYYNLSLAHLQRFEYQPAQEARSQADRLAGGLIARLRRPLEVRQGRLRGGGPGLRPRTGLGEVRGRRARASAGKNVAGRRPAPPARGSARPRLPEPLLGASPVVRGWSRPGSVRWRGASACSRMRCLKCGTPFCRRCHLGAAAAGLCTQCYHLFVVRDGVSGPAREPEAARGAEGGRAARAHLPRPLAAARPGAGHVYAQQDAARRAAFACVWSLVLALALLAGRRASRDGGLVGAARAAGAWAWRRRAARRLRRRRTGRGPTSRSLMPARRGSRRGAGRALKPDGSRRDDQGLRPPGHLPADRAAAEDRPAHAEEREGRGHRHLRERHGGDGRLLRQAARGPPRQRARQAGQARARSASTRRCRRRRPRCSGSGTSWSPATTSPSKDLQGRARRSRSRRSCSRSSAGATASTTSSPATPSTTTATTSSR